MYINGEEKATDAPPYIKNEFMIPLRPLAETIGMDILWESDNKCVSLFYQYISAYFDMKAGDIYINAKQRTDLNKAEIVNDRTFYAAFSSAGDIRKFNKYKKITAIAYLWSLIITKRRNKNEK